MQQIRFKTTLLSVLLLIGPGCARNDLGSPESSVKYFWKQMAAGNRQEVLKTQIYYREGMTDEYIFPPENIEWLYLDSLTTSYESETRARVYYQVIFKKNGQKLSTRYKTGTMVIKRGNDWKIGMPVGKQE